MAANPRSKRRGSGRTPVARLRAICLALPEATEKIAWGEPTWRVRGKLFAQLVANLVEQAYRQVAPPSLLSALQAVAGLGPRRPRRAYKFVVEAP